MSQFKFNCTHCGQRLELDEKFAGRQIECPSCRAQTLVPTLPGQKTGMTFVPESWKKPEAEKPEPISPPPSLKSGMTCIPDAWKQPPPEGDGKPKS